MVSVEFLLTSLVVVLMPGTGVIYTVSTGLLSGWRASIAAAMGCTAGIVPHLLASVLGLSAILHMSALAFQVVKFAGNGHVLLISAFASDCPPYAAAGVVGVSEPAWKEVVVDVEDCLTGRFPAVDAHIVSGDASIVAGHLFVEALE